MKKILTSLFDPNSTLVIEDDDPAPVQHVEALTLPQLSFEKPSAPARGRPEASSFPRASITCMGNQVVANVPVAAHGAVEPLVPPTMNFDPPGRKKTAAPATQQAPAANGVEPLPLPNMEF